MRNAVVAVVIVAFLSGCGGSSHPSTSSTVAPEEDARADRRRCSREGGGGSGGAPAGRRGRQGAREGYIVAPGAVAGYRFLNTKLSHRHCGEFGNHGCWRIEIVTFKHCGFFEMDINEMRRGAVVETYRDNQADVAPNTPISGRVRRHRGQRDARPAGLHLQRERLIS